MTVRAFRCSCRRAAAASMCFALPIAIDACALRGSAASPPLARSAYEQTYLPAPYNWEFRARYRQADRLFNAFDYGHAILYETLLTRPSDAPRRLDGPE